MTAKNKSNELHIARVYDAPVKSVWEAWTDAVQVGKWWGPRGFTITTRHKDVTPGGTWDYTMHGPDGVDYPSKTKFHEVEKYSRLVYDHGGNNDRPPMFRVTVNFSETGGKTKMEMTMALPTPEAAVETKKFIKKAGGDATWDRLAEYLSKKDIFVINRSFEAPIDVLFHMWTDPEHLSKWVPPTGFTMQYIKGEIKPAGSIVSCMSGEGGTKMFGKATYKVITKPTHVVYTQEFCDENEKTIRHPMDPTWPETMYTDVTLTEEGSTATRVTHTWYPYGETTPEERETFHRTKGGMTQGWNGSFDKLEHYLKEKYN